MNCKICHHTHEAHTNNDDSGSLMKAGSCVIPVCRCKEYQDPISSIDEDLL